MAGRFNGEWVNPDTKARYENACFRVRDVQLFGKGSYQAGKQAYISWDVWDTRENMEAGTKPIYSTTCLVTGESFALHFDQTYESIPGALMPGNIIMMAEQMLSETCVGAGMDDGYDPIYQDIDQAPRASVALFTGTAEQANLCEDTDLVTAWYTIHFDDWANSPLYATEDQNDNSVMPSGWYWDIDKAREWEATSETEGNWIGEINNCGEEPTFFTIRTEPGETLNKLNIFIDTQEEISGLHFQLKPTIDAGSGETTLYLTTSGGNFPGEKWWDITEIPQDNEGSGSATQIAAQTSPDEGEISGTVGYHGGFLPTNESAGLVTDLPITLPSGAMLFFNTYDQYDDSWDETNFELRTAPEGGGELIAIGINPDDGFEDPGGEWLDGQTGTKWESTTEFLVPDGVGEFISLESVEGGLLSDNAWNTFGPYNNEDVIIDNIAQSFIPLTLEGNYLMTDGEELLCTLTFTGDIIGIWEGYGTEIFSGIRAANTNFGEGLEGTNGAWALDGGMDMEDVITGVGFLGGVNGLKGIANAPIHDMSGAGGVECMTGAIQIVLDGGTEEDTLTTQYGDLTFEWGADG
jgi:hypothetical protein